ncbi:MAG: PapD-like protein [Benniella sp.]|nr:MAG: PapD-like protein [Benniella sp.]
MSQTSPKTQPVEQHPESASMNDETNALVQVSPPHFQFGASRVSTGQVSRIKLKNMTSTPVGYKFKTNAPMKYSVKPVLGALGPDESVKIFVRTEGWISPQDKFLLQCVILTEGERQKLDPCSWKALNPKRFIERYIPCASTSALSLRDLEEDAGAVSSSSATSSAAPSPPFHAYDLSRPAHQQQQGPPRHQVYVRWQFTESTRPTISIGGLGRRPSSSSSSTCSSVTPSSPGTYPSPLTPRPNDLSPPSPTPSVTTSISAFALNRASVAYDIQGPITVSSVKQELSDIRFTQDLFYGLRSKAKRIETGSRFTELRYYSVWRLLTFSLFCLLLGMFVPLERLSNLAGGRSRTGES